MTREEQTTSAYKDYLNNGGMLQSNPLFAFKAGVDWADQHPNIESIWHAASEMPNNHSYIMYLIDRYTIKTDYVPACLKHCQLNGNNWNEFVKIVNMTKWAYIEDILPKGGNE